MSGNEPIRLNFGKKLGQVELKKDGGIQESAFGKNETALSIFKHYNKDKNVVLDESELQKFYGDLEKAAGKEKKLTAGEAVKFCKGMGIKNVKAGEARDIIKSFIDAIGGDKDTVEKTAMSQGHVNVTYKNGKEEFYMYDRDKQKSTLRLLKFSDENGNHEVTFENDGKTKASEEIRTDNTIKNVEYKNGNVVKETVLKDYAPDDIPAGAEFVPSKTVGIRITKDADNNITQEFLDNSLGVLATREISPNGKTIIQKDAEGNETARFGKDESGEWKQTLKGANGVKTVVDGDKETTQFSQTRTMEKTADGVKLKDGDTKVTLKYDEEGHIIAYAKEGENFKKTAERLGIDVNNEQEYKEFCELNKDAVKRSHGGWFKIGEEVKLPTGFEAKLNVGEYDVDIKAEAQAWKDKVGQQQEQITEQVTAKPVTPKTGEPQKTELNKVDPKGLSDYAQNKSGKIPPENLAYFNTLPANRKDGENSVKFSSIQFTKSGEPYIKVETENGRMIFKYKEGNPSEFQSMSVKAKGAPSSTGFSKMSNIQALVPAWILEDVNKLAKANLTSAEVVDTNLKVETPKNPLADFKIPRKIDVPPRTPRADRPDLFTHISKRIRNNCYPDKKNRKETFEDGSSIKYNNNGFAVEIYNKEGKITGKIYRDKDTDEITYIDEFIYDNNGNKKRKVTYASNAYGFLNRYDFTEYLYDKDGKLETEILRYNEGVLVSEPSFGDAQRITKYMYDNDGNLIVRVEYDNNGNIKSVYDVNNYENISLDELKEQLN